MDPLALLVFLFFKVLGKVELVMFAKMASKNFGFESWNEQEV